MEASSAMEIFSFHYAPRYHVADLRSKLHQEGLIPHLLEHVAGRKHGDFGVMVNSKWKCLKYSSLDNFCLKKLNKKWASQSHRVFYGFRKADLMIFSGYNSYAVNDKKHLRNVDQNGKPVTKLLIPGLPDESNYDRGATISSCFWKWKPKLDIHYEKSGSENVNSPSVLFLPGFGVGTFHYEKQLKDLGRDFRVWTIDFLGQGMSLPSEDPTRCKNAGNLGEENTLWGFGDQAEPWANELVYSIDLWRDQVQYFIEEVIKEPAYIVGNSLGGYVAVYFAACKPQLVKGVTLLNATPFWGFLPNATKSPTLARMFPWAGTFPLPSSIQKLTEIIWQRISNPGSIEQVLKQVYADQSTKFDKVYSNIVKTAQHPAAAASFASIMFAPRGQLSFREALSRCQVNNVSICLMYGKEDPWVKPVWGLEVKRQLPEAPYYEISPAGHCPHDEVPEVVNYLLRGWIRNLESRGSIALPLLDNPECIHHDFTRDLEFYREGSIRSVRVRFFGSRFSLWNRVSSLYQDLPGRS
ncbi:hypothetical protein NMG60_11023440 [Bertholletia excelsa]